MADNEGLITEIFAEQATRQVAATNKLIEEGIALLLEFSKAGREATNSLLSSTSNGKLTKQFNEAADAQNKMSGSADKVIQSAKQLEKQQEKQRLAEIKLQQQREKAFDDYERKLKNQSNLIQQEAKKQEQAKKAQLNAEERDLNKLIANEERERKRAASDEKELNRLIAEEEKEIEQQRAAAYKLFLKEKEIADREYVAMYTLLLKEAEAKNAAGQSALTPRSSLLNSNIVNPIISPPAAGDNFTPHVPVGSDAAESARLAGNTAAENENTAATNANTAAKQKAGITSEEYQAILRGELVVLEDGTVAKEADVAAEKRRLSLKEILILRSARLKTETISLNAALNANAQAYAKGTISETEYSAAALNIRNAQLVAKEETKRVNIALIEQGVITETAGGKIAKFGVSFRSSFGIIRQLAYILPGIGIAGIFNVIFQGIGKLYNLIADGSLISTAAAKSLKKYNEAITAIGENSYQSVGAEIVRLKLLEAAATDITASTQKRTHAVQEMQKLYPNYLANYDLEYIKAGRAKGAIEDLTAAILLNAAAKAASEKYGVAFVQFKEQTDAQMQAQKALNQVQKEYTEAQKGAVENPNSREYQMRAVATATKLGSAKDDLLDITKKLTFAQKELNKYEKIALDAESAIPDLFTKPPKAKKKKVEPDKIDSTTNAIQATTKELANQLKTQSEINADNNKAIFENDTKSFSDRLAALQNYYNEKINISGINKDESIKIQEEELASIKQKEEKARGAGKLTLDYQKNLDAQRTLAETKITTATIQFEKEKNDVVVFSAKTRLQIVKDASAQELTITLNNIAGLKADRSELLAAELSDLKTKLDKGLITRKDYLRLSKDAQLQFAKDEIRIQIELLEDELIIGNLTREDYDKTKQKLEELHTAYNKLGESRPKDQEGILNLDDEAKLSIKRTGEIVDSVNKSIDAINSVFDAISAKRKAQYEEDVKQIDKRNSAEIEAINNSALSQELKDKKISEANARTDAQKTALAEKQKQRDIADAKRNKALTIVKIIAETALAVVHQLGSGDPYTAIARAVAAGLVGAAQIAVASQVVIPSYAEGAGVNGKPLHIGGKARFGEAGAEIVEEPGKAPYLVTTPTIAPLPTGTRVIPNDMLPGYFSMLSPKASQHMQVKDRTDDVVKAIKDASARERETMMKLIPKKQRSSIFGSTNKRWINS